MALESMDYELPERLRSKVREINDRNINKLIHIYIYIYIHVCMYISLYIIIIINIYIYIYIE